jgi:diguanylate cyclase (GGDEF)-like protein
MIKIQICKLNVFWLIFMCWLPFLTFATDESELENVLSLLKQSADIDLNVLGPEYEARLNTDLSANKRSELLRLLINTYFSDGFQEKFKPLAKALKEHAEQTSNDDDKYIADLFLLAEELNIDYKSQQYYQLMLDKKATLDSSQLDSKNLQVDIILLTLAPESFRFSREQTLINHLTKIKETGVNTIYEYLIYKALSSSQSQIDFMLHYATLLLEYAKDKHLPVNRATIIHNIGYWYHFHRLTAQSRKCAELQLDIALENKNDKEWFFAQARMVEQLDQESNYAEIIKLTAEMKSSGIIPAGFWQNFIDYYQAVAQAYTGQVQVAEKTYDRLFEFLSSPDLAQFALPKYLAAHIAFNKQQYELAKNTFNDYWWHRYNQVLDTQQNQVNEVRAQLQDVVDEKNKNIELAKFRLQQFIWLSVLLLLFAVLIIVLIIRTKRDARALAAHAKKLKELTRLDDLTGMYNRRYLQKHLDQVFELFLRSKQANSVLLMLDIDRFKNINDTCGHLTGDLVLVNVAQIIQERVRSTDLCGRFGGEEFLILLRNTDTENAIELAEKLRIKIENLRIKHQDEEIGVTISIGVAAINLNMKLSSDWIKQADTAMYQSKQQGRNKTTIYSSSGQVSTA